MRVQPCTEASGLQRRSLSATGPPYPRWGMRWGGGETCAADRINLVVALWTRRRKQGAGGGGLGVLGILEKWRNSFDHHQVHQFTLKAALPEKSAMASLVDVEDEGGATRVRRVPIVRLSKRHVVQLKWCNRCWNISGSGLVPIGRQRCRGAPALRPLSVSSSRKPLTG